MLFNILVTVLLIPLTILSSIIASKLDKSDVNGSINPKADNSEYAFATLVTGTGDGYVKGAIVLAQSLIEVKSKLPRYVLLTPDVPESSRDLLSKFYYIVDVTSIICNHVVPFVPNGKLTEAQYDQLGSNYKNMIRLNSKTCK